MTIRNSWAVFALFATMAIAANAQVFTTLQNLDSTTGTYPDVSFVQTRDGNLYTSTANGGTLGWGTILGMTPEGEIILTYSFNGGYGDGNTPMVLDYDGNLYGTYYNTYTFIGGVFKFTADGTLTDLHEFHGGNNNYGPYPSQAMALTLNGDLYGTTAGGGQYGGGTVFKITPAGAFTNVYNFNGKCGEYGCSPSGLTLGNDGNFYGTTSGNPPEQPGTFFKMTREGKLTVLYNFDGINQSPNDSGLALGPDGNFYGTTPLGGANKDGTIFKATPGGSFTTIYTFAGPDGANPYSKLIVGDDGNFYGVTYAGGANGYGTIFSLTPAGTLTTLHSFDFTDGGFPYALMQHTNGTFYGTTTEGGTMPPPPYGGTFYSFNIGLPPFAGLLPPAGKAGTAIEILGQGFTGATAVSFNGTAAEFKVFSDTFIGAMVPSGATTGYVTVTTNTGTLKSNVPFQVVR